MGWTYRSQSFEFDVSIEKTFQFIIHIIRFGVSNYFEILAPKAAVRTIHGEIPKRNIIKLTLEEYLDTRMKWDRVYLI